MPCAHTTYLAGLLRPNGVQIFCLHGGLSPTLDTLDHIRSLDRIQEVRPRMRARPGLCVSWGLLDARARLCRAHAL